MSGILDTLYPLTSVLMEAALVMRMRRVMMMMMTTTMMMMMRQFPPSSPDPHLSANEKHGNYPQVFAPQPLALVILVQI